MLDGMIEKQKIRILRETLTVDHALQAIEGALDKADKHSNPIISQIDDLFAGNERWLAELLNDFLRDYVGLNDQPRMMAGSQERKCDRLRRKLVKSLRKEHPELDNAQRWEKANELSDEQLIEAVKLAHHQATGTMMAGPVGDVGEWLSGIWEWILANWPTILKVLLSLLVFI